MNKTERFYCRATPEEKETARRVSEVTGDDISTILRKAIVRLAKRHGIKMGGAG